MDQLGIAVASTGDCCCLNWGVLLPDPSVIAILILATPAPQVSCPDLSSM